MREIGCYGRLWGGLVRVWAGGGVVPGRAATGRAAAAASVAHWWSPARAEDAERTISKRNGVTDMCKYGNVHISSKIRVWACTLDSLGDVERKKTGVACVIIQHHNPP